MKSCRNVNTKESFFQIFMEEFLQIRLNKIYPVKWNIGSIVHIWWLQNCKLYMVLKSQVFVLWHVAIFDSCKAQLISTELQMDLNTHAYWLVIIREKGTRLIYTARKRVKKLSRSPATLVSSRGERKNKYLYFVHLRK